MADYLDKYIDILVNGKPKDYKMPSLIDVFTPDLFKQGGDASGYMKQGAEKAASVRSSVQQNGITDDVRNQLRDSYNSYVNGKYGSVVYSQWEADRLKSEAEQQAKANEQQAAASQAEIEAVKAQNKLNAEKAKQQQAAQELNASLTAKARSSVDTENVDTNTQSAANEKKRQKTMYGMSRTKAASAGLVSFGANKTLGA